MTPHLPDSATFVTCREVANRLRVQPATVRRWSREGLIPTVRIRAKVLRFDFSEVMRALRRRDEEVNEEQDGASEGGVP